MKQALISAHGPAPGTPAWDQAAQQSLGTLFSPADAAFRDYRRAGLELVTLWLASSLPPVLTGAWLFSMAWQGAPPTDGAVLLHLLLASGLLTGTLPWYLVGQSLLLCRANEHLQGERHTLRQTLRLALPRSPALAGAMLRRWGITGLSLLPLGTALPLARTWTAMLPVRAVLGRSACSTLQRPPDPRVVASQILAVGLLLLCTVNLALAQSWLGSGKLLDMEAALPRLESPTVWLVALLVAATLVEPWRQLALLRCLATEPQP